MKNSKYIYILGVGNNTLVYIELAESCGYTVKGLYHYSNDRNGEDYYGYQILGSYDDIFLIDDISDMNFALSQGDNKIRAKIFDQIVLKGGQIPTLMHPTATVSRFAKLGQGVVLHINVVVHPNTTIGDNTVLSYNSSITHSSSIGSHCYLAAQALVGAYTKIGNYVFIGFAAVTISAKVDTIGSNVTIGAGSLVTKSIPDNCTVAGTPARLR